jgi:hypothetical protein
MFSKENDRKMKIQTLFFKTLFLVTMVIVAASCSNKKQALNSEDQIELEIKESSTKDKKTSSKWPQDNGVICLLLGYGFNDKAFEDEALQSLAKIYGLEEDGGLIWPLTYPEDFSSGGKEKIASLYDMVKDKKIKGILLLGAPENTNSVLARLQDDWSGKLPYPVFSFFPQDDILGMEATCDFVIEYERSSSEDANSEDSSLQIDKSVEKILVNAIRYMAELPGPLPSDSKLHEHVQQIVGKDKKIRRFTDSETGLQSINHFVIERDGK